MPWIILLLAVLVIFAYVSFRRQQTTQSTRLKPSRHSSAFSRAEEIISSGGPKTRRDYYVIFPDACPRCTSRQYNQHADQSLSCARCYYNAAKTYDILGAQQISSPYLSMERADAIAEFPYEGGNYLKLFLENDDTAPSALNEDATFIVFIEGLLRDIFLLPEKAAMFIMAETHLAGRSYIMTLPQAKAQQRLQLALKRATVKGYPLPITVEEHGTFAQQNSTFSQ